MKYARFSDDFLSNFRLDDNGETLVLTDKRGYTRAVKLLSYEERPQGEWIVEKDVYCRCPFCNFKDVKYSNYCPDCGADMRPKPNQLRDCENCIHHSENGCEVWECEFKKRSDL